MAMKINFFIPGIPAPGGSKNHRIVKGRVVVWDAGKGNKEWKETCAVHAQKEMRMAHQEIFTGPIKVDFLFHMSRPKNHFLKDGVREDAPIYHLVRPDLTKLIRSTEDALTGICWEDDALIAKQENAKIYGAGDPGCYITITDLC